MHIEFVSGAKVEIFSESTIIAPKRIMVCRKPILLFFPARFTVCSKLSVLLSLPVPSRRG